MKQFIIEKSANASLKRLQGIELILLPPIQEPKLVSRGVEEFLDAYKDILTSEMQSLGDQEILLLATKPLKDTNADKEVVDRENDNKKVDVVMTPPQNSELFSTLKVLQITCLYHDVG